LLEVLFSYTELNVPPTAQGHLSTNAGGV